MDLIIKENKPDIDPKTQNCYFACIKNISKGIDTPLERPDDLIIHYDKIMEYLLTLKTNSRKTKLASIRVCIEKINGAEDIKENYLSEMRRCKKEIEKREKEQLQTPKVIENFIPWETILARYEKLRKETLPLWKFNNINEKQFFLLQDFIMLSCYTLIEPRRSEDFCEFKIRNYDTKTDNYMIYSRTGKSFFVFNKYKMAYKEGPAKVEIPNKLKNLIFNWCKKNPYDYLLVNTLYNKCNQTRLYTMIANLFDIRINDEKQKKISTGVFRHAWLTYKYGHINSAELQDSAVNMGSKEISRVLAYVVKPEQLKEEEEEEDE